MQTHTDGPYKTFSAETPATLVGKEFYVVEQVANKKTIALHTTGIPIGVLYNKLEGGTDWNVRLFGGGGSFKVRAGGAITTPGRVKPASGGKVVSATTTGDRSIGIKTSPETTSADGDIIEVLDVVEKV